MELAIRALLETAGENSSAVVLAVIISTLVYLSKYTLEWAQARWSHKAVTETARHDDVWKLYEEKKHEVAKLRRENRKLWILYRESLTYHMEAQNTYTRSMSHVRAWIHDRIQGKFKCSQQNCPVRSTIDTEIDQVIAATADETTAAFRLWMQASTSKDTPPET